MKALERKVNDLVEESAKLSAAGNSAKVNKHIPTVRLHAHV